MYIYIYNCTCLQIFAHDSIDPEISETFFRNNDLRLPLPSTGAANDGVGDVGAGIQELLGQEDLHIVRFDVVLEPLHGAHWGTCLRRNAEVYGHGPWDSDHNAGM